MSFKVVEGRGFHKLINQLEPIFTVPYGFTVARNCYELFLDEKKELQTWFKKSCIRVCLTTDCWTSNQNLSYMCLTSHFVDGEWRLQKRIMNFSLIENHKGETIGREIERCLRQWGIENVFTITVDNASSNDGAIKYLKRKLDAGGGLVCGGKHLHISCAAHILNLVVSNGLMEQQSSIDHIRNDVRYVRSSPQRHKTFKECIEAEMIMSQSLVCLDVPTHWNSTYLMLKHAEKFEKAFDRLYDQEIDFQKWFSEDDKGNKKASPPTETDWQNSRIFIQFLKTLYDVTLCFSSSLEVMTSHKCFQQIVSVQSELNSWKNDNFKMLGSIASSMQSFFDKYWGNVEKFNPLLLVVVVLDPRYKLEYVTYCIEDMYDEKLAVSMSTLVMNTLSDLYTFYSKGNLDHKDSEDGDYSKSVVDEALQKPMGVKDVTQNRVEVWKKQKRAKANSEKSNLERYLDDDTVDDVDNPNFNILDWWKNNSAKYMILSLIARDVLLIPVSTVASESCFSTSGRVLGVFRSSLSPKMSETLICAQNWLNPVDRKFDEDFDQFDNTQKIVDEFSSKILESQGGNDTQEAMHIDLTWQQV